MALFSPWIYELLFFSLIGKAMSSSEDMRLVQFYQETLLLILLSNDNHFYNADSIFVFMIIG